MLKRKYSPVDVLYEYGVLIYPAKIKSLEQWFA